MECFRLHRKLQFFIAEGVKAMSEQKSVEEAQKLEVKVVAEEEAALSLPEEAWSTPQFMETLLRHPKAFFNDVAEEKRLNNFAKRLFGFSTVLLGFYGLLMGLFGGWVQGLASMIKLPLLFLATLGICLPSFYIFNLVLGSKLKFGQLVVLLLYAVCLTAVICASLAPVAFFFMICSSGYHFMVLLHVAIMALAGLVGLKGVVKGLQFLSEKTGMKGTENIFRVWLFLYAIVGAQMSWILRPFIGAPNMPFQIFRPIGGNFFTAILKTLWQLLQP